MSLWWKEVWCSYCRAAPGEPCVSASGRRTYAHADRLRQGEYYGMAYYDEIYDYDEAYDYDDDDGFRWAERGMITVYLPGDAPPDLNPKSEPHPARLMLARMGQPNSEIDVDG